MSEETSNPLDVLSSVLNADLSGVETSYPVLPAGLKTLRCTAFEVKDAKDKPGSKYIEMKLVTTEPETSTAGKPINPGFPIIHRIGITPTYNADNSIKYDPRENIARLKEAFFGDKNAHIDPSAFLNACVLAQVKISKDEQYGTRNELARFVPAAKKS